MMLKRLLLVSFLSLTAISASLGLLSIKHFTLLGWLLLSAEIFAVIAISALLCIGIFIGFAWVFNADDDESFLAFSKSLIERLRD